MDFIIFTSYQNKPINIIVEDFTKVDDGYTYAVVSVIVFDKKQNKQIEIPLDDFNNEDFIDNKVDEVVERSNKRGWLSLVEIID